MYLTMKDALGDSESLKAGNPSSLAAAFWGTPMGQPCVPVASWCHSSIPGANAIALITKSFNCYVSSSTNLDVELSVKVLPFELFARLCDVYVHMVNESSIGKRFKPRVYKAYNMVVL